MINQVYRTTAKTKSTNVFLFLRANETYYVIIRQHLLRRRRGHREEEHKLFWRITEHQLIMSVKKEVKKINNEDKEFFNGYDTEE